MRYNRPEQVPYSLRWRILLLQAKEKTLHYWRPLKHLILYAQDIKPEIVSFSFDNKPVFVEGSPVILRWEVRGAYKVELCGVGDVTLRDLARVIHNSSCAYTITAYGAKNTVQQAEIVLPQPECIALNRLQTTPSEVKLETVRIKPQTVSVNPSVSSFGMKSNVPLLKKGKPFFTRLLFTQPDFRILFRDEEWYHFRSEARKTYAHPTSAVHTSAEPGHVNPNKQP